MSILSGTPTSQKAGERPITFILDDRGFLGEPITLPIRPEDLTRNEGMRATVHQTMGRETAGWVDHFGPMLPSCTISGNTGWRIAAGTGLDGMESFLRLNDLLQREYPDSRQAAIDDGVDPATVRLLFIDALDSFAWQVVPQSFVLRRSKSRPLLFQYNITLQAISTKLDDIGVDEPEGGNIQAGLDSLDDAIDTITGEVMDGVTDIIDAPLASLNEYSGDLFAKAGDAIRSGGGGSVIDLARDVAKAGTNVYRSIEGNQRTAMNMASAYSSVASIFSNSLSIEVPYEDYTDLYGASNCSSTTEGRPPSKYAGQNVFGLIVGEPAIGVTSSEAAQSISALKSSDPVLAPMSLSEIERHISNIVGG